MRRGSMRAADVSLESGDTERRSASVRQAFTILAPRPPSPPWHTNSGRDYDTGLDMPCSRSDVRRFMQAGDRDADHEGLERSVLDFP